MGEDALGGALYQSAFEEAMWEVLRPWLDAALVALDHQEGYASFWCVWSQVCLTLEVVCLHRRLREEELQAVWRALVEAQYPGGEEAWGYGGMAVPYVC